MSLLLFLLGNLMFYDYRTPSVKYVDLALKKCDPTDHEFTIHGWWPEYDKKTYPQWCDKSECDKFEIADIDPDMIKEVEQYWYACPGWSVTTHELWKHEWCKHGTCLNTTVSEYFRNALNAYYDARSHDWYGCKSMIPFDLNGKWKGYCSK